MRKIFVYGTLRVGGYYASYFDNYRLNVHEGYIHAQLYDLGVFPAIKLSNEKAHKVYGEIHTYSHSVVDEFDRIECFDLMDLENSLYVRKEVIAFDLHTKRKIQVYVYEFNQSIPTNAICIPNGLWERRG